MKRREFCITSVAGAAAFALTDSVRGAESAAGEGELLYNGIRLPKVWPPARNNTKLHLPTTPPYLERPPAVVNIDVGRPLSAAGVVACVAIAQRTRDRSVVPMRPMPVDATPTRH